MSHSGFPLWSICRIPTLLQIFPQFPFQWIPRLLKTFFPIPTGGTLTVFPETLMRSVSKFVNKMSHPLAGCSIALQESFACGFETPQSHHIMHLRLYKSITFEILSRVIKEVVGSGYTAKTMYDLTRPQINTWQS
jgi:hypothetical protein